MPRYFFNLHDRHGHLKDDEGRDLPNFGAVRSETLKSIRALICDDVQAGRIDLRGYVEVTDDTDRVVLSLRFVDAVAWHLALVSSTDERWRWP